MNENELIQEFLVRWYITWGMNPVAFESTNNMYVDESYWKFKPSLYTLADGHGLFSREGGVGGSLFTLTPKAIEIIKERLNE